MKKLLYISGLTLLLAFLLVPSGSLQAGGKDYIKGRELTEAEIAAQKALEPKLKTNPVPEFGPVETEGVSASRVSLPAKYDARTKNLITAIRNQRPYGSCWAFSAIASAETSMIRQGLTVNGTKASADSLDLSELQLLYFFYHTVADDFGGTKGDSTKTVTMNYLEQGGNGIFTTFALASWLGVASEEQAVYKNATPSTALPRSLARNLDVAHMQNAYWVSMSDIDAVKQMVYTYGTVGFSFYYDDSFFNFSTAAYYNDHYTKTNHAVNVVGWDDNYSRENFDVKPSRNGAWLVKNNWSDSWGDKGYFWLSYEEISLTGLNGFGFVYEFEPPDNYDYIYQYDGSFGNKRLKLESGESAANVFTVKGADYEQLKAVSLAAYTPGIRYSLQIYRNPDAGAPESGTPMLQKPQTGTIPYTGYVTIPIAQDDVIFNKGDTFAVVFTVTNDGKQIQLFEDYTYVNAGWISFTNTTAKGQSYYKEDGEWKDLGLSVKGVALGTAGETVRIKAFAERTGAGSVTELSLSASRVNLEFGKSKTLKAKTTLSGTGTAYSLRWISDNPDVATVSSAGKVTAVAPGKARISVRAGRMEASCEVTVGISTPELVIAKAVGYRRISVTWNAVASADGYLVYRKPEGGSWQLVRTVTGRSSVTITDQVPKAKEPYIYTVRAYAGSGDAMIRSGYDKTGVYASAVPDMVELNKIANIKTGIQINWTAETCSGYRIYRKADGGDWKLIRTIKNSRTASFVDTAVQYGTEYTYTVMAYFGSGSNSTHGTYNEKGLTQIRTSGVPVLTSAGASGSGILVKWKSTFAAKGFIVYRKAAGAKKWSRIAVLPSKVLHYQDNGAKKGVTYTYTVRSYRMLNGKNLYSGFDKKGVSGSY